MRFQFLKVVIFLIKFLKLSNCIQKKAVVCFFVSKNSKFYKLKLTNMEALIIKHLENKSFLNSDENKAFNLLFFIGRLRHFKDLGLSKNEVRRRLHIYRVQNLYYKQIFDTF